jgi:hypothetical protein
MGTVEIGILDRIGQVDGVATDEVNGCVAVNFLIGEVKVWAQAVYLPNRL